MTIKLFIQAISKFLLGMVVISLLIFLPAGTINYLNGWLFLAVLFIPIFIVGIILMVKNPLLLKRRLSAKEKQKEQGIVIKLSGLMFIVGFLLAGFDYRYNWTKINPIISYIFVFIFLLGYIIWAFVLKQNAYLSRTIKVEKNQEVVTTGLYKIVRHPMYTATLLVFLSMPIILGSLISLIVFLFYPIIIVVRIIYEEKLLEQELKGYLDYKKKVKYRLIPFIW